MYLPECNGTEGYSFPLPPAVYIPDDVECKDDPCRPVWVNYKEERPFSHL